MKLDALGLGVSGGRIASVGVGGLITGGGMSLHHVTVLSAILLPNSRYDCTDIFKILYKIHLLKFPGCPCIWSGRYCERKY